MRLVDLRISHYKSLSDIELTDIPPVTVLVGCNGVGKSNVADALRFLRDAVSQGLDHAVSTRGGIGLIRQYSPTKPFQISFDFGFAEKKDHSNVARYQLTLTSLREGNFRVERERSEWVAPTEFEFDDERHEVIERGFKAFIAERNAKGHINLRVDGKTEALDNERPMPLDALALGSRVTWFDFGAIHFGGVSLRDFILNFRFSAIYPNTLRQPAPPDTDPILKENGANWASILRNLKKTSRGKQAWEQVREMMQVVMPQLEDISPQAVGGFIMPRFKVRETSGEAHLFDPSQISDGTLRILGILLALYQTPHPSLMVIEEPEQTVNPALLALLADAFREVSERTQLLITSHSPHLIDCFEPENIRVVSMHNGETRISPIHASQREAVKEHLLSLEQIMSTEGLLPEDA
ncbi:MAG: ATPase [Betaproteobacteria bacterium HGW-Betaproteobacteria-12]|nr:MAG: ATPase [Betaproteobacteria bacterium HGW-Betaproteobacteria-12]